MGQRSRYPQEFRDEAIALALSADRPMSEVARSLGVPDYTLWRWVRESKAEGAVKPSQPSTLSKDEQIELKRLRKENAQQKIDMEILRKAAAYFAKETLR